MLKVAGVPAQESVPTMEKPGEEARVMLTGAETAEQPFASVTIKAIVVGRLKSHTVIPEKV